MPSASVYGTRPDASASAAARRAAAGAGWPGWPTSMCVMVPPSRSIAAASDMTSMTMKGETSERREGSGRMAFQAFGRRTAATMDGQD